MKVLIVDDSNYMRNHLKNVLSEHGYEVVATVDKGETAIDVAMEIEPDLITLDIILPDMTGTDVLEVIKNSKLRSKVILVSAVGQESTIEYGLALGASDFVVKPFTEEEILDSVRKVME